MHKFMENNPIEKYKDGLKNLIDNIWDYSELAFRENRSCKAMVSYLKSEGFEVEENIAGMDTAFVGVYGNGSPVICILAEYDSLSGLSQECDIAEYKPIEGKETGHGCGHQLLGTGSIGAALLVRDYLKENNVQGTIKIVGCPAEESGSGKAYLARDGFFDDCDIALCWHPDTLNIVTTGSSLACMQVFFRFHGISSHAAAAPHLGRSALDAVELMNVGVNYLREHIEPQERVHYAITNTGGISPNVVQREAEVAYMVRSSSAPKAKKLYERVCKIAKGAAMMTETEVEILFDEGCSDTISNCALENVLYESFLEIGAPKYTKEELDYAQKFKDTVSKENLDDIFISEEIKNKQEFKKHMKENPICDYIVEHIHKDEVSASSGSTDVGDVSWVVPTAQIRTACFAYGVDGHSWQYVAQGKSKTALKGTLLASNVLALGAIKLIENPKLIEKAKVEFNEKLDGQKYECLIPKEVKPHIFE